MEKRVPYRVYKKTYPTAQTVPGSYDADRKTIVIIMSEETVKHLRFSPPEWTTDGHSKRLNGHLIKIYQWGSGEEAHFEIEASETEDGGRMFRRGGRYICENIPGFGPSARDAAIRMAKELASSGNYVMSDDFSPFRT